MKILILGGTREARLLGCDPRLRVNHDVIFSLAGVTQAPLLPDTRTRIGGFGGVAGLVAFLTAERIDRVIDATHPFAARISANAVHAACVTRTPMIRLTRAPWRQQDGDDWTEVARLEDVIPHLRDTDRNVLLTTGRQHIAPFLRETSRLFYLRTIEAPSEPLPTHIQVIEARPPFTLEYETALMQRLKINTIVSKNSGAQAVSAKLQAARLLNRHVVMVARPTLPAALEVTSREEVLAWVSDTIIV